MPSQCPQDGGFIGKSGCTHPNHRHSELVKRLLSSTESPDYISEADAESALREGFYVNGPDNRRIGFGPDLLAHLDSHDPRDAKGRKERLAFAIAAVAHPDAVEEKHRNLDGRTAYLRAFDGFGVLAVTGRDAPDIEDVFTFVPKRGLRKRIATQSTPGGAS